MAKEARQFVEEEAMQGQARGLARAVFVKGLGVATTESLMGELELANAGDRQARRKVVMAITGGARKGQLNGIFSDPAKLIFSTTKIELTNLPDGTELMRRSDISAREAEKRYTEYKPKLDEAIAEKRRSEEERRNKQKEKAAGRTESRKEKVEPVKPKVHLEVMGYQRGENDQTMQERQKQAGIAPSVRQEKLTDPTVAVQDKSRLLLPGDIDHILQQGISREALQSIFPVLRQSIIANARLLEEELLEAAEQASTFASGHLDAAEEEVFVSIPAKRVATLALVENLAAFTQDDLVSVYRNIGSQNYFYEFPLYPYYVLELWHGRFFAQALIKNRDLLKEDQSDTAKTLVLMIDDPQRNDIFKNLVRNREVEFNNSTISAQEIDDVFAPIVLPDEVLLRAVWQDILGAVYPMPYVLVGDDRESGLTDLRLMADHFGLEEIYNLLSGTEADFDAHELAVYELEEKISSMQESMARINKSDKNYRQIKAAFDRGIAVAKKSLAGLQRPKSIQERIEREVEERVPRFTPNPNDYRAGEQSTGYRRAREKYERYKERIPNLFSPDPKNYIEGENSSGYLDDIINAGIYSVISANRWKAVARDRVVAAVAANIGNEESILAESIFA